MHLTYDEQKFHLNEVIFTGLSGARCTGCTHFTSCSSAGSRPRFRAALTALQRASSSSKSLQASTLLLGPSCRSLPPLHRSSCRSIHHGPSAGSEASTGSARSEPRCGSLLVHTWRRTAARFCGGVSCVSRTEVLAVFDPSVTPCRAEDERPNRDEPTPDLHPIYFSRYGT